MKTITFFLDGDKIIGGEDISDEEKLIIGDYLFDQREADNDGQVIFYTGITECTHETTYINDRMQTVCSLCGEELGR